MVLPLLAAGIGAAGNIIGGIMGAKQQEKTDAMNYQIALMNYYQQEAQRREMLNEAHRQERESKLGTTDEEGNTSKFVPGVGWVSKRGAKATEMADLYRGEELAQMQDLKAKRKHMYDELGEQGREGNVAGGLLEAMLRNYRRDPSQAVGRRNRMTAEAANEGYDVGMAEAMKDAMRTGTGGQSKIASQFGRDKYNSLRKAFMENAEGATEAEENRFMTEQGNLANMYNLFATRRSADPEASYNPRNLEGAAAASLSGAMSGGQRGSSQLMSAFSAKPENFNFEHKANMGIPTTIAQAGSMLAGGLNLYDSTRGGGQQNYGQYASNNYFPSAPSGGGGGVAANMYKGNVGLF